ncbi:MAG TPA: hypothetical protein VGR26_03905, partial [Acidimicrobiales bacterium]|nr:hypothetical protein [Acidimicrobiales bacterium]
MEALPKVADLLFIPRYAAAAVRSYISGDEIPDDPVELALSLADRALVREDAELPHSLDRVREWLGDMAFAFEALGVTEVERSQLALEWATEEQLDWLVERTLLFDADGAISFPAQVA